MTARATAAWADDTGTVSWVERQDDGRSVVRASSGHLVSYLRMADVTREIMRGLRASRFILGVKQEDQWLRISWANRVARANACEKDGWFAERGIPTYEGDLPAVRRWAIDNDVEVQRPRLAYLDIETCARVPLSRKEESRILCWTFVAAEDGRVISGMLEQDTDEDERRLLAELWQALGDFDQVAAWNGDGFDFPVIFARSAKQGIRADARRWLWLDHMEAFRRFNTAAESGDEKQSMALQAVAQAVLGEGKIPGFTFDRIFPAWAAGGEEREKLLEYNVHDVALMRRIEERTGFIDLLYTLCSVTGTFPDTHGMKPMPQVETFVFRLALRRGIHFATKHFKRGEEEGEGEGAIRGAFVMDPLAEGIVRERVHVADFSAMYPSIVQSWNMSPETVLPRPEMPAFPSYLSHLAREWKPPPRPEYVAESGTGCYFDQRERGLLPEVLDTAIALRKKWNDRKGACAPQTPEWVAADRLSTAYKVFANSVFGVATSPVSRIHSRDVGESITQTGVMLIKVTMAAAQERGLRVIYGDTDSLFVTGCTDEEFKAFVAWCNEMLYPRVIAECGCKDNRIKLAYEKAFERVVFISAKRYAARWAHYKGTLPDARTKPEVKGLEYRRGDSCKLARSMQAEVVDALMGGGILRPRAERCADSVEELHEAVLRWRKRVMEEPLALDDVVLSKRLSRALKEYASKKKKDGTDSAQPPHVRVAKLLRERGDDIGEGARVAYFVTDGMAKPAAVAPAQDWTGECDRFAVWEDQVWPPTERVLAAAFPGEGWSAYARVRPARPRGRPVGPGPVLPWGATPSPGANAPTGAPGSAPALFRLDPPPPKGRKRGSRAIGGGGGSPC